MALPYLTSDLPGIGGRLRDRPSDFVVREELPYVPTGVGDHVFARVEKTDCTTARMVAQLAAALGVAGRDLGTAGIKDRHAVTEQWVSLPPPVTPQDVLAVQLPEVRVLEAVRHPHKLRTGHVRRNHFALIVRGVAADAARAATAVLAALCAAPGAPNWYGEQRFGAARDNAAHGLALVRRTRRFDRDGKKNRFLLSALQSELFNRWLTKRLEVGAYRQVLPGDLLRKVGGGVFATTAPEVDQARLVAGEVLLTGPMFGVEMRGPAPGTAAAELERAVLADFGLTLDELGSVRKLAPGARRDAQLAVGDWSVEEVEPGAICVRFHLPAGGYATAVLREVQKLAEPDGAPAAPGDGEPPEGEAPDDDDSASAHTAAPPPPLSWP